jgi:nucleoside-diphosphate-sugar epimerase
MQFCVSGVAGFIGSQLAEALLLQGESVVGVDTFTSYYSRPAKEHNLARLRTFPAFRLVEADLRTTDPVALLDGCDVVLHQAGQPGVRGSWGLGFEDYVSHNISVTQRLLEAARRTGVQRFVYASSSSIYGNATDYPTTEATVPQPYSPYGVTKLAAEHLCSLYAENWGLSTVSLRYFTVYGPRQRPDMAFHRFIAAALRGEEITVFGDGEQRRDFTYVGDVVRANLLAARRAVPAGSVLNIAGGSYATVNQILNQLNELLDRPLRVRYDGKQAGDVLETRADCRLARLLLNWAPNVSLREGLANQLRWQRGLASEGEAASGADAGSAAHSGNRILEPSGAGRA